MRQGRQKGTALSLLTQQKKREVAAAVKKPATKKTDPWILRAAATKKTVNAKK